MRRGRTSDARRSPVSTYGRAAEGLREMWARAVGEGGAWPVGLVLRAIVRHAFCTRCVWSRAGQRVKLVIVLSARNVPSRGGLRVWHCRAGWWRKPVFGRPDEMTQGFGVRVA